MPHLSLICSSMCAGTHKIEDSFEGQHFIVKKVHDVKDPMLDEDVVQGWTMEHLPHASEETQILIACE